MLSVPVQDGKIQLKFQHQGQLKLVNLSLKDLNERDSVRVLLSGQTFIDVSLIKSDDLYNYVLNFLQYYFVLLNFKDAIAEGDIFRVSNTMKLMVPFYYNHSALSKYMVECIDYVLRQKFCYLLNYLYKLELPRLLTLKVKLGKIKHLICRKKIRSKK